MQTFQTHDGLALYRRDWPAANARGTVLLVHGLGEHIERYAHVAAALNGWGWHVVGYDQRGHGRSGGARGRLPAADDLLRDLAVLIDAVRAQSSGPLVLLGHSMGGVVAARFVAEALSAQPAAWYRPVDGLVLSSPAIDPGMTPVQRALLAMLGPLAPNLAVNNGLRPRWICRDPNVVQAYVDDPLVHDRITPRLVRFIVDGGATIVGRAPQWQTPTLLLYAGGDRCVSPAGSRAFAAVAPRDIVQVHEFPPLFHEIFNEPEREQVFAPLRGWLEGRAG